MKIPVHWAFVRQETVYVVNQLSPTLRVHSLALAATLLVTSANAFAQEKPAFLTSTRQAKASAAAALRKAANRVPPRILRAKASPVASQSQSGLVFSNAATDPLAFEFVQSTYDLDNTTKQRRYAVLTNFVRLARPIINNIYGTAPSYLNGHKVKIVGDQAGIGYAPPLDVNSLVDGGTIQYTYQTPGDVPESMWDAYNQYSLARCLLGAYHGEGVMTLDYVNGRTIDPWETAFQDAAAMAVMYEYLNKPATFDPQVFAPYVLPIYDTLNTPNLGNVFFGYEEGLGWADIRAGMAQAAWLKVYVENPEFFKKFNAQYDQAYTADKNVVRNVGRFKQIAAGIVPTVEGRSFNDWYRKQFALDAEIKPGKKLYLGILPYPDLLEDDPGTVYDDRRSMFEAYIQYTNVTNAGVDTPVDAVGSVKVLDENGTDVSSKSDELQNTTAFEIGGDSNYPGAGGFSLGLEDVGTPDRARLNVQINVEGTTTHSVFPYSVSGTIADPSRYYGAVKGGNAGALSLAIQGGSGASATVQRGVWNSTLAYPSGPRVKTAVTFGGRTFWRNSAWLQPGGNSRSFVIVIDANEGETFAWNVPGGASQWRLISVPLTPIKTDEADILGVPAASLGLGRFKSQTANRNPGVKPQTFGIDGTRHQLYPNIAEDMAPGRGYWLKTNGGYVQEVEGIEPSRSVRYEVPLYGATAGVGEWNQIGVPFNKEFAHAAIRVRLGDGATVSWDEAVAQGIVGPGIWRWRPAGGYQRVDNTGEVLRPFLGYYVYAAKPTGVTLIFNPTSVAPTPPAVKGWKLNITAATSAVRDTGNSFGVSTTRVPAAKPPGGPQVPTLRFLSSGSSDANDSGAGAAGGWADSFLPSLVSTGEWTFVVDGATNGQNVTLSWGDLGSVPSDIQLRLLDVLPNTRQRLLTGGSYSFIYKGVPRAFKIIGRRVPQPTIQVAKAPSAGYTVTVTTNVEFAGVLDIKFEGQTVKVLKNGSFPVGTTTFTWDGKNVLGQAAEPGTYRAWLTPTDTTITPVKAGFNVP